jgi:hypothetical protein
MNRKLIVISVLLIASMLLAACAAPTEAPVATEAPSVQNTSSGGGKLEVFLVDIRGEATRWIPLFNVKVYNLTAEIINATIAGGGGSNARVLQTAWQAVTHPIPGRSTPASSSWGNTWPLVTLTRLLICIRPRVGTR